MKQSGIICWFRFLFESLWLWLPHHCSVIIDLLSSAVRFTLHVRLSTCVREWVRMCESECTWQAHRNTEQPERACGWPVTLNVHWGSLIITNNACGEAYYIWCDTRVMKGEFFTAGKKHIHSGSTNMHFSEYMNSLYCPLDSIWKGFFVFYNTKCIWKLQLYI